MSASGREVVVHPDADLLATATAARLALAVIDAQSVREEVHVVLTGGRVGTSVVEAFGAGVLAGAVDPTALHVWWGDERFLPTGDAERNDTAALAALAPLQIPAENLHTVAGPDVVGSPEESADRYAAELARYAAPGATVPGFDVLLLGVGPDGHVASLFPGQPGLEAQGSTVGVHGSPKPPPQRVSLTLGAIAAAARVWLVAAGAEKADAVSAGLAGDPAHPCALVTGRHETLWLLDVAAPGTPPD